MTIRPFWMPQRGYHERVFSPADEAEAVLARQGANEAKAAMSLQLSEENIRLKLLKTRE